MSNSNLELNCVCGGHLFHLVSTLKCDICGKRWSISDLWIEYIKLLAIVKKCAIQDYEDFEEVRDIASTVLEDY